MRAVAYTLLIASLVALGGCKQDRPKEVKEEPVFGTVQETRKVDSEKQLIFQSGQDPYQMNWGSSTAYYVKIDDVSYPVIWDDAEKVKALKVGDKVNLHPSEFICCVGENDMRPTCHRMMRVFKSERRINPLQVN